MSHGFEAFVTTVLGLILTLVAVGATMAAQPGPAYLAVQSFSAEACGQTAWS